MNVWSILAMKASSDEREIKRAYARKLKVTRPEDDPQAFQELREAYETALRMARHAGALDDGEQEEATAPGFAYEEAPVYTAVYESDAVAALEAPVYQAVYEFDPQPAPEPVSPMVEARRVWAKFLPGAHYEPAQRLATVAASEELLNLQVRECFELCAVQYCASEGCAEDFRGAIVEHFRWEEDASFVAREMPGEIGETLMRLRAHRSHVHFCDLARNDEVVRALLSDTVVKTFIPTTSSSYTKRMRDLLAQIHWHHSEMLELKLNHDVFNAWAGRVEGKRYFFETGIYSFFTGLALTLGAWFALADANIHLAVIFVACELLAFGLFALFAFQWPHLRQKRPVVAAQEHLKAVLYMHRYRPRWQFGWLVVYAFASLCMFIPNPSDLSRWSVAAMMLGCAIVATFANSAVMTKAGFAILAVIAAGIGFAIARETFSGHGAVTCIMASLCMVQILYRGGADLLDFLSMRDAWFLPARAAWLAGAAGLLFWSYMCDFGVALLPPLAWAWVLGGMLLSRPSINPVFAFMFSGFAFKFLEGVTPGLSLLAFSNMHLLAILLVAVAFFMAVNMSRAKTNQHQFS